MLDCGLEFYPEKNLRKKIDILLFISKLLCLFSFKDEEIIVSMVDTYGRKLN